MKKAVSYIVLVLASSNFLFGQTTTSPVGPPVTFMTGPELLRAIRTATEEEAGQPGLYSLRLSPASEHPVIGIRRTKPTKSELHAKFTDVWYVLQGSAILTTGGSIVDGEETGDGEIRGRSISGGISRRIRAGEYAVVPAGTAHWVSRIIGKELLYIVVKVPSPGK